MNADTHPNTYEQVNEYIRRQSTTQLCTNKPVNTHKHKDIKTSTHTLTHTHTHKRIYTNQQTPNHTTHTHTHKCICTHTQTHTHTRTRTRTHTLMTTDTRDSIFYHGGLGIFYHPLSRHFTEIIHYDTAMMQYT